MHLGDPLSERRGVGTDVELPFPLTFALLDVPIFSALDSFLDQAPRTRSTQDIGRFKVDRPFKKLGIYGLCR